MIASALQEGKAQTAAAQQTLAKAQSRAEYAKTLPEKIEAAQRAAAQPEQEFRQCTQQAAAFEAAAQTLEKQVQMQVTEEQKSKSARKVLIKTIQETADFLNYSVEVITKQRDAEFFETMYVRKESIKVLRKLNVYEPFCFSVKINDNYYLDVQKKVTECILNLVRTDELIEFFLKRDMRRDIQSDSEYLVSLLIRINNLVCGGGEMNQAMRGAYACAKAVVSAIPENKYKAYRQKLTSAVVFNDYDRCCQILLRLSIYSGVTFDFVYDLFENFEKNKDVIYTFINALTSKKEEIKKEG